MSPLNPPKSSHSSISPGTSHFSSPPENQAIQSEMEWSCTSNSQAEFHPSKSSSLCQQTAPVFTQASSSELQARDYTIKGIPEEVNPRGSAKKRNLTLDARLSRLENILQDVVPSLLETTSAERNERDSIKNETKQSPLELPEDPLLDGAVEDAILAGRPVTLDHHPESFESSTFQTGSISTANLFLELNQNS